MGEESADRVRPAAPQTRQTGPSERDEVAPRQGPPSDQASRRSLRERSLLQHCGESMREFLDADEETPRRDRFFRLECAFLARTVDRLRERAP